MNRRHFFSNCLTCGAHVYGLAMFAPSLMRRAFAAQDKNKVIAEEKWGRIEKIQDGVYSLISTPFQTRDFSTLCNGGIVVGDKGVLAVESFAQAKGATWLAEQAKRLTGRWPTDVVCTHYHGDHTSGHQGYFQNGQKPRVWLSDVTKEAAEKSFSRRGGPGNPFQNVSKINRDQATEIDLGNRKVKLVPRDGHTASDITIEVVDPKVVFCGDLFFNRMFPNYSDATPSKLEAYLQSLDSSNGVTYVPGHGPIADEQAMKNYKHLLSYVREEAEKAFNAGKKSEDGAKEFKLPQSLSDWTIWSPQNARLAFAAWYKELSR